MTDAPHGMPTYPTLGLPEQEPSATSATSDYNPTTSTTIPTEDSSSAATTVLTDSSVVAPTARWDLSEVCTRSVMVAARGRPPG